MSLRGTENLQAEATTDRNSELGTNWQNEDGSEFNQQELSVEVGGGVQR